MLGNETIPRHLCEDSGYRNPPPAPLARAGPRLRAPDVGDIHDQRAEHMGRQGLGVTPRWLIPAELWNYSTSVSSSLDIILTTPNKSIHNKSTWAEWLVSPPSSWPPLPSSLLRKTTWTLHQTQDCSLEMWQQVRMSDTNELGKYLICLLQICCLWISPWLPMGPPSLLEDLSLVWPSTSWPLR